MRLGGEMAVDDINAAGGIKALAGAIASRTLSRLCEVGQRKAG
jgi:hypothetical protein